MLKAWRAHQAEVRRREEAGEPPFKTIEDFRVGIPDALRDAPEPEPKAADSTESEVPKGVRKVSDAQAVGHAPSLCSRSTPTAPTRRYATRVYHHASPRVLSVDPRRPEVAPTLLGGRGISVVARGGLNVRSTLHIRQYDDIPRALRIKV